MIVSVLRKEARQNLKGKWKKALLIMLLFFTVNMLITFFTYWISANTTYGMFSLILNIVITVSLNYGLLASFIRLKRNEKVNCIYPIYYASKDSEKVWKVIGRMLLKLSGYIFVWMLSLYLMITEFISLYHGYGMRLSYFIEILCVIIFSVLISMKMLYYSLNNNVLYDNRKDKAKEILKESERLIKNHRWDFVKMNLSFTGWFLLGILFSASIIAIMFFVFKVQNLYIIYIAYIPLIFLMPYIQITNICFYDNLVFNNPKPKDSKINNKRTAKKKNKR